MSVCCALHELLPGVSKDGHVGGAVGRPQRVLQLAAKLRVYRADGLEGVGQDALRVKSVCHRPKQVLQWYSTRCRAVYAVYEASIGENKET